MLLVAMLLVVLLLRTLRLWLLFGIDVGVAVVVVYVCGVVVAVVDVGGDGYADGICGVVVVFCHG